MEKKLCEMSIVLRKNMKKVIWAGLTALYTVVYALEIPHVEGVVNDIVRKNPRENIIIK